LIPDRVAKQKYQNNNQLYSGTPGIPLSRVFHFSPDNTTTELAIFTERDQISYHRPTPMENLDCRIVDVRQLGA
jgi:hypothetical protein